MTPEKFGKILDKIPKPKIELSKVELSLKDDIKTSIQKNNKIIQKLSSEIKKVVEIQKKYNSSLDADTNSRKELNVQIKNFKSLDSAQAKVQKNAEKIAKELGVQITDISNWNQFDEIVSDGMNVMREAITRIKSLY